MNLELKGKVKTRDINLEDSIFKECMGLNEISCGVIYIVKYYTAVKNQ